METRNLKKIFGVETKQDLARELKPVLALLDSFGLCLRFIHSEDKWYLVARTEQPPADLSKTELETLCTIYKLQLNVETVEPRLVACERKLKDETIQEHIEHLKEKGYLMKEQGAIRLSSKSKLMLNYQG
jgi:hypothetical protein